MLHRLENTLHLVLEIVLFGEDVLFGSRCIRENVFADFAIEASDAHDELSPCSNTMKRGFDGYAFEQDKHNI